MFKSVAGRVLNVGICIIIVLLGLHLTLQYVNLEIYQEKQGQIFELSNRVDFDDEVSLPTWFSQFLLLTIAASASLVAILEKTKNKRRAWAAISIVGLLLSIDEIGSIHEFFLQTIYLLYYGDVIPTNASNAWLLVLPVIILAATASLVWLYKLLPRRTWVLFLTSGLIYLSGAVIFELFSNDVSKTSYTYQGTMTGIEETLEMAGALIGLYAIIDYLQTKHAKKLTSVWKQLTHA